MVIGQGFAGCGSGGSRSSWPIAASTRSSGFRGRSRSTASHLLQLDISGFGADCSFVSYKYLEIEGEHHGEYYGADAVAQSGMFFLAAGTDLVTFFMGLELMALCFYVMVGFLRATSGPTKRR